MGDPQIIAKQINTSRNGKCEIRATQDKQLLPSLKAKNPPGRDVLSCLETLTLVDRHFQIAPTNLVTGVWFGFEVQSYNQFGDLMKYTFEDGVLTSADFRLDS